MVATARELGVQVHVLVAHYVRCPTKRGLIFGYGAIDEDDIPEGLMRLRRAMRIVNAIL
jgi:DNA-binding transcriptional MocR family regulator